MTLGEVKFLLAMIGGAFWAFLIGGILLVIPDVPRWRAIAAFPLGLIFLGIAFRSYISMVESQEDREDEEDAVP